MPATALALLTVLAPSCSEKADPVLVDGIVRARDGSPFGGATVHFFGRTVPQPARHPLAPHRIAGAQPGQLFAVTNAQGYFSIELAGGLYEVWIGGVIDSAFMPQHAADMALRPPRSTLDLRYSGFRVSGRMIGPGGTPLASGHVFVLGSTNTMRADLRAGAFSMMLPRDSYVFWANPDAGYVGVPRVRYDGIAVASDTTIDLSVDGHAVAGTVTGPGGTPLGGAWVSAYTTTASAYAPTATDGTYRLYLPTREYTFRVESPEIGVQYPPILIDAPRTLNFDLSGPPTANP